MLNVESGERIRAPLAARLPPYAAVGRSDGADVLAALDSNGLHLFDLGTGKQLISTVKMSSTPNGVAWGRVDDRDVIVTAHFATLRVWNPRTGRKITELKLGTRIGSIGVRNADDGRHLVGVSGPGLVLTELKEC